ncbi:MAG TPA: hypothetical protein VLY21_01035 [Nitrososphaerales archaeon]|nr:hypothetical protein [Nitrososphaerales archaeon]
MSADPGRDVLIPGYAVGAIAIVCGLGLILTVALGPLGVGIIHYRTSQSGTWQVEGNDLANFLLMVPLLLVGGALQLAKKSGSKYLLVLTPITLMYTGLSYGIGEEYGNTAYSGNVESYFWLYLILIIGGLLLLVGSLPMFNEGDAPNFGRGGLRVYVGVFVLFFLVFAGMWISQIMQVVDAGDLAGKAYSSAPVGFWTIRYLDLGFSIPLGLLALFLLLTKPRKAYSLVLLFFGFGLTTGTAVNTVAIVEVVNHDPTVSGAAASGLVIFPILGILIYAGFFYLIRDKLQRRHFPL